MNSNGQTGRDDPAFKLIKRANGAQAHTMDSNGQHTIQNTGPYYQQGHLSNVAPAHNMDNSSGQPEVPDAVARAQALEDSVTTDTMGPFELEDTSVPRHDPTYGSGNMITGPVELPGIETLLQQGPALSYPAGQQAHGLAFSDSTMQTAQQYPVGMVAANMAAPGPLQTCGQAAHAVGFGLPSSTAAAPDRAHNYHMSGAFDNRLPAAPKPEFSPECDVRELMAMAVEYAEQKKREEQAAQSAKVAAGRISKKTKELAKSQGKKGPTAMQRAPVSVSHDGGSIQKSVEMDVDLAEDGLPGIKVHPGSDVQNLAEAVARPRDEQVSASRAGSLGQGPRVKVPYLPIDDAMSKEEQLRRAARNQQISEMDRADRRARNNEAARKTRERARQAVVDAQAQADEKEARVKILEAQIVCRDNEIKMLKQQLAEKEME